MYTTELGFAVYQRQFYIEYGAISAGAVITIIPMIVVFFFLRRNITLQSLQCSMDKGNPACADTGWPLFFCKVGNDAPIQKGFVEFEDMAKRMVEKATEEGYLRKTMKHPLTGFDPGNNIRDLTYRKILSTPN